MRHSVFLKTVSLLTILNFCFQSPANAISPKMDLIPSDFQKEVVVTSEESPDPAEYIQLLMDILEQGFEILARKKMAPQDQLMGPIAKVDAMGRAKGRIQTGDAVISFNFRRDRTTQMTEALAMGKDFTKFAPEDLALLVVTMFEDENGKIPFQNIIFPPQKVENTLGEWLSNLGKRQFRISETQKFPHVTRFFNGGFTAEPFPNESRLLIPSPEGITFDQKPQMSGEEITVALVEALQKNENDFYAVNYPSPDMVGHTGNLPAVIKAIEYLDGYLKRVISMAQEQGINVMITADHGNADEMLDKRGNPQTKHSTFPVPFIFVPSQQTTIAGEIKLKEKGGLANLAPTILHSMGLSKPDEMTESTLLENGYTFHPGQKTLLIILDGFGHNPNREDIGDATRLAKTPYLDELKEKYPHTILQASGEAVGLSKGTMGNSEVCHMVIGSGRILKDQPKPRVDRAIQSQQFSQNEALLKAIHHARDNHTNLQLMGLVSEGNVHASLFHIFEILKVAKEEGMDPKKVFIHAELDGRDVHPQSAKLYIAALQRGLDHLGIGEIVSMIGREWSMDRDVQWDRTKKGYDLFVRGTAELTWSAEKLRNGIVSPQRQEFLKEYMAIIDQLLEGKTPNFNLLIQKALQIDNTFDATGIVETPKTFNELESFLKLLNGNYFWDEKTVTLYLAAA